MHVPFSVVMCGIIIICIAMSRVLYHALCTYVYMRSKLGIIKRMVKLW